MRRILIAALTFVAVAALPASAQTIRAVVTDRANDRPLAEVAITLIDAEGNVVGTPARSDSLGMFTTHAGRGGNVRIRAVRIGYQPLTSDPIKLDLGQLVTVRLQMTTVAQELPTVRIVERRRLHSSELMTSAGFDLRRSRGIGTFMSAEQLAEYGDLDLAEVLRGWGGVTVRSTADGDVLALTNGCAPDIVLDGLPLSGSTQILSSAPEMVDDLSGRRQNALSILAGIAAKQVHGIEIYRDRQLPPPSMSGLMGMDTQCGVIAIWTKNGIARTSMTPRTIDGRSAVQVIVGEVVDQETRRRVPNATLSLIGHDGKVVGDPVVTDSIGEYRIRTTRAGNLRLQMTGPSFRSALTPPFTLSPEELVVARLYVSVRGGILAPMAVAGRTSPSKFAPGTFAGFAYRRERAIGGTFIGEAQIQRSSAPSIGELVAGVVRAASESKSGSTEASSIVSTCRVRWFVDGTVVPPDSVSALQSKPLTTLAGVEIYESEADAPGIFTAATVPACRIIGVWTTAAK